MCQWSNNEKIDKKKKEQKLSGEKSERGKYSVQIWQSDPMNSPKAFGELKILPKGTKRQFERYEENLATLVP